MEKFFYRVKKGDTVINISNAFGISPFVMIAENKLSCEVEEGDLLYVKKCKRPYKVMPTDTLEGISQKFCISKERLSEINCHPPYIFYGIIIETEN